MSHIALDVPSDDIQMEHHHMNHDPTTTTTSTATTIVQKVLENVTEAIKTVIQTTTTTVPPLSTENPHQHHHEHEHNHHDHSQHVAPIESNHENHGISHSGHDMKMWFHGGANEVILFDFWRINSYSGLLFSCLLIFIMGAAYEGLKWFRIYLQLKDAKKSQKRRAASPKSTVSMNTSANSPDKVVITLQQNSNHNESLLCPSNEDPVYAPTVKKYDSDTASVGFFTLTNIKTKVTAQHRIIQALLYSIQITVAYFLMLIAMTYNVYLTAAVVLGAGFGHWLFALIQESSVTNAETVDAITSDACH